MTNKSSLSYLYASKSLLPFESIDFGILITPLLSQITTNSSPAWISSARDPRISRLLKIQGSPETTPTPDRAPGRAKSVLNTSEEDLAMRGTATASHPLFGAPLPPVPGPTHLLLTQPAVGGLQVRQIGQRLDPFHGQGGGGGAATLSRRRLRSRRRGRRHVGAQLTRSIPP